MDAYRAINEILVHLFNEIWELEEKAVITDEYKDITNNDMHIIEAVGLGKGNNMTAIAKKLKITVGSSYDIYEQSCQQKICGSGTERRGTGGLSIFV